jgi:ABC-2 type transport system permease protein
VNIFLRELKTGLKPFFFWTLGLFALVFMSVAKSTGALSDGAFMTELLGKFPRIVVAVMGMANVDVSRFEGIYAMIMMFVSILTAVYATHLGRNAVSRESVDRTYEFLFTKPRARSFILAWKLLAALIFLSVFAALTCLFSTLAVRQIRIEGDFAGLFARFALDVWLIGIVFFSLAAMFSATFAHAEHGARAGNLAVLAAYALAVVYDMIEHPGLLRLFSPFRYFLNTELINGTVSLPYAGLCLLLTAVFLALSFNRFERRDLGAL